MKQITQRLAALVLSGAMLLPAAAFAAPSQGGEEFNKQLSELVKQDDEENFFGEMALTIGSNILTVDGTKQTLDAAPALKNNRTMLPIRAVAEAAGAEVDFDDGSRTVVITGAYGDEILCPVGSTTMTVNAEETTLDTAAYINGGRTYVPVRAVTEALNMDVEWDAQSRTVTLTAPYQSARVLVWADSLDAGKLGAEKVIQDGTGLWVLQFATPAEAKDAAETLNGMGITAEGDAYLPPVEEPKGELSADAAGDHYTWGAVNSGFDEFLSRNAGLLKGSGVVAVVDTGVDGTHPFLKGRTTAGWDYVDGDSDPKDEHYHGTHVAGTILDCVGSTNVKIMPVRVLGATGSGSNSTVVAGIKYAADHGADVINLSLGGGHSSTQDAAISYAIGKGAMVAIAAGNKNTNTISHCPAHITTPGAVVVSAGDSKHQKANFSNYGSSVDLMAPGVSIRAAVPGGGYRNLNGTSMATPHAAAAAMLLDMAWGKSLTPAELEGKVRTATTYGTWKDQQMGCGFLDLRKAEVPSAPKASVTLQLQNPQKLSKEKIRLSMKCVSENAAFTKSRIYLGTSSNDLERIKNDNFTTSSSNFTFVHELDISAKQPGTYYYQLALVAGEDEYRSEVGRFTIDAPAEPVKPDPEPTKPVEPVKPDPEPTKPVEPVKPDPEPTKPVEPVKPEPSDPVEKTATAYAVGTDGTLAVNDKAAVSPGWSTQLTAIPEGAACTVYTDRLSGSWYYVSYNGVSGYAHKNYLTFNTRTGVVHDAGRLAINNKPAVSPRWSTEIGTIPDGASVRVYPDKTSGSWYYVTYNGITGYAHKNYITLR